MRINYLVTIGMAALIAGSCSTKNEPVNQAFSLTNLDTTVSPATDFYQYACGGWLKNNPLGAEYARFGTFDKLAEDNQKQVRELIEKLATEKHEPGTAGEKIGLFFASAMDSALLETQGAEPIKNQLAQLSSITDKKAVMQAIVDMHKHQMYPFFYIYAAPDDKNSLMTIANTYQGGLGMSDRDYYLLTDAQTVEIRSQYEKHVGKMFVLAGIDSTEAAKKAQRILAIETRLAKAHYDRILLRDPVKNYHKLSLAELQKEAPSFDWTSYFKGIGLGVITELNVGQLSYIKEMDKVYASLSTSEFSDYLSWNLINASADYLSDAFVKQNFEFYGKVLSGREELQPRWKRAVESTNSVLGEAVGQLYVANYFPPQAKERMLKLVDNLKIALGERIAALEWMSDTTKAKAQEKLAAIVVKIGYPDKWRDYSKLEIKTDSYWANIYRSGAFDFEWNMNKVGKPVDRTEWHMTPQTVNAYYNPTTNEICFPAGILQPPFFYLNADDAMNYGAIGVVIGHEMTHGFDDQGRQYDKDGNLNDWWTADDAAKFNARTQVLVNHFDNISVLDTVKANGRFTLGENIADQGGLQVSYQAFMKTRSENTTTENEKIDGFTPEQRFFLSYANVWANNIRDKEILRRTKEDPHSLGKWRVNGALPHVDAFYKAFDVKEGDLMYLAPEKRAKIW